MYTYFGYGHRCILYCILHEVTCKLLQRIQVHCIGTTHCPHKVTWALCKNNTLLLHTATTLKYIAVLQNIKLWVRDSRNLTKCKDIEYITSIPLCISTGCIILLVPKSYFYVFGMKFNWSGHQNLCLIKVLTRLFGKFCRRRVRSWRPPGWRRQYCEGIQDINIFKYRGDFRQHPLE